MGRDIRKNQRLKGQGSRSRNDSLPLPFEEAPRYERVEKMKTLTPKNPRQKFYLNAVQHKTLTFGLGPAGTGKTFLAAWTAADLFDRGEIKKIIVTRPAVEAGENLGFLPGEMEEKIDPYFVPVREALERRLGKGAVEYHLKDKNIEFVPLAFMRGRTFDDAFVILDEAQNTTPRQMKMFLTRIGERSRVVVNGDLKQSDIPGINGLADAIDRLEGVSDIVVHKFTREDVVRSGLAQVIVDAYEGDDAQKLPSFITQSAIDSQK